MLVPAFLATRESAHNSINSRPIAVIPQAELTESTVASEQGSNLNNEQADEEPETETADDTNEDEAAAAQADNQEPSIDTSTSSNNSAPDPAPSPASVPEPTPTPTSTVLSASSSYSFVNNLRQENSVDLIERSSLLENSAVTYGKILADDCKNLDHMDISVLLGQNVNGQPLRSVAENLGYNSTIGAALVGLENSPGHFANMIGDFEYIGIGVIQSNSPTCSGRIYVVMQFGGV